MQDQSSNDAGAKDGPSTIDDIKALAPVTEEWFKAKSRQYSAGKQVVAAEWSLLKKSFLVVILFLLLFTSFTTVSLITINVAITYALLNAGVQWLLTAAVILILNLIFVVLCWLTVKRIGSNISMSQTKQIFNGKTEMNMGPDHE